MSGYYVRAHIRANTATARNVSASAGMAYEDDESAAFAIGPLPREAMTNFVNASLDNDDVRSVEVSTEPFEDDDE